MRIAGLLHVVRGARLVESPRFHQISRQRRGRQESLIVLIGPVGGHADETCRLVVRALEQEFLANQRSLTSVLLRGLRTVHERLRSENQRALLEHQVGASVTAALLGEDVAYLALSGGAGAVVARGCAVDVIGPVPGRPLGMATEPAIELHQIDDAPDVSVLLTSSPVVPGLEPDEIADLLARDDRAALDQLRALADPNATFSAALLRSKPAPVPATAKRPPEPPTRDATATTDRPARSRQAPADRAAAAPRPADGRRHGRRAGAALAAIAWLIGGLASRLVGDRRSAGSGRGAQPIGRRKVWQPALSMESLRIALLLAIVFIVLGVVATLAWIVPRQAEARREASAAQTLEQAEQTRLKALLASDADTQRRLLQEARDLATNAAAVPTVAPRAEALIKTIAADLDRLNAALKLDLKELAGPAAFAGGVKDVRSIAVGGGSLFALADGRVHRFQLAADGRSLAQPTSHVLAAPGAANLVWLCWAAAGGNRLNDGLIAADEQRNLWGWTKGDALERLGIRNAAMWGSFRSARSYEGNLYILDSVASQVLRYPPSMSGYESEYRGILDDSATLADAVDLAIDGNVFILTSSGKVWKFVDGHGTLLSLTGLDRPLKNPRMIFTTKQTANLYIADTDNNRIVVLEKNGRFLRQFVMDFPVRAVEVDEFAGRLYVAGPTGISVGTLPQ